MGVFPIISVIVPVYQVEDYIEACLTSIVSQDYMGRIECIIVDDCGTDSSMTKACRFIENYQGRISFSILHHESNKGLSAARNTGIRHAKGDYILFVDSDDRLTLDALSTLYKPLSSAHYDMVVGMHQYSGLWKGTCSSFRKTILHGSDMPFKDIPGCVWNKLIRTSFIKENQLFFFEGIVFEDDLWSFQSDIVARSVYAINRVTYCYTIREGSITSSTLLQKRVDSLVTVISEMHSFVVKHNLSKDERCHNWIERYRVRLFKLLIGDKRAFMDAYCSLRERMCKPWLLCFKINGFHPLKQIRDFHLFFPANVGARFYYLFCRYK